MASGIARAIRVEVKATGRAYWAEYRTGFRGREYNFGGGWRPTLAAAFKAAEAAGELSPAEGR